MKVVRASVWRKEYIHTLVRTEKALLINLEKIKRTQYIYSYKLYKAHC